MWCLLLFLLLFICFLCYWQPNGVLWCLQGPLLVKHYLPCYCWLRCVIKLILLLFLVAIRAACAVPAAVAVSCKP
jgi:hypothetical protein